MFILDNVTVLSWLKDSSTGFVVTRPKATKSDKDMCSKYYPWLILMVLSSVITALDFQEEILTDNLSSQIANSSLRFFSLKSFYKVVSQYTEMTFLFSWIFMATRSKRMFLLMALNFLSSITDTISAGCCLS